MVIGAPLTGIAVSEVAVCRSRTCVEAASPEQIAAWAERVLSATTLAELLAG